VRIAVIVLALSSFVGAAADAKTVRLTPTSKWFEVLHGSGLKPGDEVILAPGTYSDRRRLEMNHRGTEGKVIAIRAKGAILKRPDARQNSINMAGCQYLEIHDLEITGGSTGIWIERQGKAQPKHLLFEGLHIHHVGGVAITANHSTSTYERLVFRGNHIHHTAGHGEAFYLGGNNTKDGSTTGVMFNSIVERNYIHHLNGPKVSQGDGIEIKDGSYGNIIRDNVIHDTKYPGVIVYGTDGRKSNVIERNVIWNTGDNGIQAAADAIIRNNIIFNTGGNGIYSRDHQSAVVGTLFITHNTVVTKGRTALRIIPPFNGRKFSGPIVVANNALYGATAIQAGRGKAIRLVGNAGSGRISGLGPLAAAQWQGGGAVGADFVKGERSFYPAPGSCLIGKAAMKNAVADFNGTKRSQSFDAGAYRFNAKGNPGWKIAPGFKK
jgi:hypothetical protein